jgi:hypothetical protein
MNWRCTTENEPPKSGIFFPSSSPLLVGGACAFRIFFHLPFRHLSTIKKEGTTFVLWSIQKSLLRSIMFIFTSGSSFYVKKAGHVLFQRQIGPLFRSSGIERTNSTRVLLLCVCAMFCFISTWCHSQMDWSKIYRLLCLCLVCTLKRSGWSTSHAPEEYLFYGGCYFIERTVQVLLLKYMYRERKNKKTMYIYTNNGNNSVCRVGVKFRVCGCDIQKSDPINRHKKKKKNKKFDMKGDQFHSSRNWEGERKIGFTMNNTSAGSKIPAADGEEKKQTHTKFVFFWCVSGWNQKFWLTDQGL